MSDNEDIELKPFHGRRVSLESWDASGNEVRTHYDSVELFSLSEIASIARFIRKIEKSRPRYFVADIDRPGEVQEKEITI